MNGSMFSVTTAHRSTILCGMRGLLAFALLGQPFASSWAAPPNLSPRGMSDKLVTALAKRGDLTLRDLTLKGALFTISKTWDINIVVGDEVQGQVHGVFADAPLHEILESILLANGFSYRPVGDGLVVMKIEDLGEVNPLFESTVLPVRYASIPEVVVAAGLLNSPQGQIRALPSARAILVIDFPDRIQMIRKTVESIEQASNVGQPTQARQEKKYLQIAYLSPHFIPAETLKEPIESVLSKDGKVAVMSLERQLIVVDYPEHVRAAREVLETVDHPRPQVRIHALIYDISLEDIEELGINWNHAVQGRFDAGGEPETIFSIDSITKVPFTAGDPGGVLTFMNLSRNFDITAVVLALQQANDARLLANPNVTVLDGSEAIWESVQEIPFQQLTETEAGGNIGTTAFREAGIKLRVTPRVSPDGTIEMHVQPEFSRLTGFTSTDSQPIIDRRTASTTVRVHDRQTIVISGLRQRTDTGSFNGIPGFKNVKILGNLFRARNTTVRESELIVFIMPEIVSYGDPPKPRQLAAAETNLFRLNQIPVAEGLPPPPAVPCEVCKPSEPSRTVIELGPESSEPRRPERLPRGDSQDRAEDLGLQDRDTAHPVTSLPPVDRIAPRAPVIHLPSVEPSTAAAKVEAPTGTATVEAPTAAVEVEAPAIPVNPAAERLHVPQIKPSDLRKPYSSRYRSSGSLYGQPGEKTDPTATDTGSGAKTEKTWLERIFPF